jgi:hypothetical protein
MVGGRTARLYAGKLYVEARLVLGGGGVAPCYHWSTPSPFEATRAASSNGRAMERLAGVPPTMRVRRGERTECSISNPFVSTTEAKRVSRTQPGSAGFRVGDEEHEHVPKKGAPRRVSPAQRQMSLNTPNATAPCEGQRRVDAHHAWTA